MYDCKEAILRFFIKSEGKRSHRADTEPQKCWPQEPPKKSLVQLPISNETTSHTRWSKPQLSPVKSWTFPRTGIPQFLWVTCFSTTSYVTLLPLMSNLNLLSNNLLPFPLVLAPGTMEKLGSVILVSILPIPVGCYFSTPYPPNNRTRLVPSICPHQSHATGHSPVSPQPSWSGGAQTCIQVWPHQPHVEGH